MDDLELLFQDKIQEKGLHWCCIRDCPADLSLTTDRSCFEIRDTGVGISPEEQENLFQEFYQAGSFFHRQFGTGLGLHIAKELSLAMYGDLGLISKPGKGSCFSLHLPISLQHSLANPA